MGRDNKSNQINQIYFLSVLILILMAVFSTLKPSIYTDGASAEDWNRHSVWIRNYIKGDFSSFYKYPPLFHLFMIPFVLLLDGSIKYFQIILAFLVICSMSYFLYKKEGKEAMMIVFFILSASIAFQIWFFQLMPQTLDYILFPLIALAYFNKKYFTASLGLIVLLYNHLFGIVFLSVFFIYSLLFNEKFLKYFLLILILSMPVIYVYYLPNIIDIFYILSERNVETPMIISHGSTYTNFTETKQIFQTKWDLEYTKTWYMFLWSSGVIIWLFLPYVIYVLYKTRFKINRIQIFYLVWLLCFLPVLIFNIFRAMGYIIIPLTFFEASIIINYLKDKDKHEIPYSR